MDVTHPAHRSWADLFLLTLRYLGDVPKTQGKNLHTLRGEKPACLKVGMEFSSLKGFPASPVSPGQFSSFSAKSWPHSLHVKSGLVARLDLA